MTRPRLDLSAFAFTLSILASVACSRVAEGDAETPITATSQPKSEPEPSVSTDTRGGTILGETWSFEEVDGELRLTVGDRRVLLEHSEGCWVTDQLHACWPSPEAIADKLIRFHPDFSPLAREPDAAQPANAATNESE